MTQSSAVFTPITLPCGRVVQNRLVKVALYEHLGQFQGGPPTQYHLDLYAKWALHPWGMVITGNVTDAHHMTLGRDITIPDTVTDDSIRPYAQLAKVIHGNNNGTLALMQVSHAGRQSTRLIGGRGFGAPWAPSSVKVGTGQKAGLVTNAVTALLFDTPREMGVQQIDEVVETFVRAAVVADKAGFDGVQLHAAHGYLLAEFLAPKTNKRHDEYSLATLENAVRLITRIIHGIRKAVQNPHFILGVKLNSADYTGSSDAEERVISYIRELAKLGMVDLIEISGGDYENPDFINKSQSESPRQALFAKFSQMALSIVSFYPSPPLIMVTGGLSSSAALHSALLHNHAQLLGVGRISVLRPDLPTILPSLDSNSTQPIAPLPNLLKDANLFTRWLMRQMALIPMIGAGANMAWYTVRLRDHALGKPLRNDSGPVATVRMLLWCSDRTFYGILSLFFAVVCSTMARFIGS